MECQICFAQESFKAPCCISYCFDCLIKWMEHQGDEIKCPNQNCQNMLTPDVLEQMIKDKQQKIRYHEVLLRKYLIKDQSTRACPSKCNYYGFIDPNQRCEQEIECMKCGYSWTEYSILSYRKKEEIEINNFMINSANALFDFWYTQECIVCNTKIQKNGGCPNMTCSICKTIFCWICKQNCSINHRQEICSLQMFIKVALSFYGLFTLIQSAGYHSYFGFVLYYIGYFALANISVVLLLVSVFFGLKVHWDLFFGRMNSQRKVEQYLLFLAAFGGFFIVKLILSEYYGMSFRTLILFIFSEMFIFGSGSFSIQALSNYKLWQVLLTVIGIITGMMYLGAHNLSLIVFALTEINNLRRRNGFKNEVMILHFLSYLFLDFSFYYLIIIFVFDVAYTHQRRMDPIFIFLSLFIYFIFNWGFYYILDSNDQHVEGLVDNTYTYTIGAILWILKLPLSFIL